MNEILLGFEVGSGNAVRIPFAHTVVCGQTQASGKTTTLEGLLSRTGDPQRPALAFLTKRAESAFATAHVIPPYFRDRADWRFVESILQAMMREKMKYQREWIIRVCEGAQSLEQVAANINRALNGSGKQKPAKGFAAGMYLQLSEYFKLLMPELKRLKLDMSAGVSRSIDAVGGLQPGLNVMDLSEYSTEMQSLAIASSMELVYEKLRMVITVVPEAWEFLPQSRNTPVKLAGEALVRKGAASKNFMWLDSQDITGVDKAILKQVGVWILGVQREVNEVEHTLAQMGVPKKLKPQPDQVMQLRRGEFFVCFGDTLKRVYVKPAWLPEDDAIRIAIDLVKRPANALEFMAHAIAICQPEHKPKAENMDASYRTAYEELKKEYAVLKKNFEELQRKFNARETSGSSPAPTAGNGDVRSTKSAVTVETGDGEVAMALDVSRPVIDVTVRKYVIEADDTEDIGRLALMISEGFFDSPRQSPAITGEFRARGWMEQTGRPRPLNLSIGKLAEYGFIRIVEQGSYQSVPGMKVNVKEVRTVA